MLQYEIGVIYALAPRDAPEDIRYVGKTQQYPRRPREHANDARNTEPGARHLTDWIRSLDFEYDYFLLEIDPDDGLEAAECRWIQKLCSATGNGHPHLEGCNCRLTNLTRGGDGQDSLSASIAQSKWSNEAKERQRERAREMGRRNRGRKRSEETIAKFRLRPQVGNSRHKDSCQCSFCLAKHNALSQEVRDRIICLWRAGKTTKEIMETCNVGSTAISRCLRAAGIYRPRVGRKCHPGCTCGRHKGLTSEHKSAIAAAQRQRHQRESVEINSSANKSVSQVSGLS